jgi:hypothetical protein
MRGKLAALVLAAMIAGLGLVNVSLYNTPVDISPIASAKGRDGNLVAGPGGSLQIPNAGDFAETFERPLFSPTRRKFAPEPVAPKPVEVAAAPVEQQPVPPPPVAAPAIAPSLLGISIHGGATKALLRIGGGGDALWYGNGETVDGWTVSSIDKDQAVLERDGKIKHLPLYPSQDASTAAGLGQ